MFSGNARHMQQQLEALKSATRAQWSEALQRIFAKVRQEPQAGALLDRALQEGVRIHFESKHDLLPEGAGSRYLENKDGRDITLSVLLPEADLASALAHELRHYWQYTMIGGREKYVASLEVNPRLYLVFKRVIEADAFAFQERFKALRAGTWGEDTPQAYRAVFQTFLEGHDADAILKHYDIHSAQRACSMSETLQNIFRQRTHGQTLEEVAEAWTGNMDVARLRRVLRFGVEENSPRYDDRAMDDAVFLESVLHTAVPECRRTAGLLEQFNRLVLGGRGAEAETLVPSIEKEMTAALNRF